jgi:proteasome beta subunit
MREYFQKNLSEPDALKLALTALYNAADDDVGTGGPDFVRGIYPTAKFVTVHGIADVPGDRIRAVYDGMIDLRRSRET